MRGNRVIGYHGCDRRVGERILGGEIRLKPSQNKYDWLGSGRYFWEDDYPRAMRFAQRLTGKSASKIHEPFVIGAIIDLGHCLNLLEYENLQILRDAYETLEDWLTAQGKELPVNRPRNKAVDEDLVLRDLDCAVMEMVHTLTQEAAQPAFDSVRSVFWEGPEVYPSAGFRVYNHIQICVRNPNCILGYFRPHEHECGWVGSEQ